MTKVINEDAKRIKEFTGKPMKECKNKAERIAECVKEMKNRIVEFSFLKKDGSVRKAFGTLQDEIILPILSDPSHHGGTNPELVTYFDIDAKQFRSFRKENFLNFVEA
ncbi:hypothetical protein SAMN04488494_0574 [Xylanibacter ruminicola]|jgi:hypothetical protein|uniref:Uncharacterized protein n=1 Tax=Xylanibacter ruminicola TaxID=839 RepID=A0A1M7CZ37_XYLRU|nr:SH3 beta-barrel fold-containing protein [Xylanibacter ruminicola]SHL72498.1 hypothetical protein SAMN04488494_0574 [Xylanibacter ruminicola]